MRIKSMALENYRLFEKVEIPLVKDDSRSGSVVVFVGNNGSGKTTILEALSIGLSWLVARIGRAGGQGSGIKDLAIANGKSYSLINTVAEYDSSEYGWRLSKTLKGRKKTVESDLTELTALAELFRDSLTSDESASLPLLAYYPVERTILDIPLKIRTKHSFGQLDGLDGSLAQGVDFRRFFEWFREREDSESEIRSRELLDAVKSRLLKLIDNKEFHKLGDRKSIEDIINTTLRDRQLNAVREAIGAFMPGFENLRIERRPRLRMVVDKYGSSLNVEQLSQGEKSLMALVGSIASRLSMMNPSSVNPLEGRGVIMIDEIDLHLHPKWQRGVVDRLRGVFPNCQFILTTHSPLVISNSQGVLVYVLDDGIVSEMGNMYGMDANQVLLQEMGVDIRNPDVQEKLDAVADFIQMDNFAEARKTLSELEAVLPENHWELNKVKLLLLRREALCAKDN